MRRDRAPRPGFTRRALAFAALLLAAPAVFAIAVEEVPSPRPAGWVVDTTGTLSEAALRDLNALAERVHAEAGAEMAVVVVDTVGSAEPRAFAVRLFNTWGIGTAERDDGVLVFLAVTDRAAEIVLGDGIDGPAAQTASDRAMQQEMVPRFRTGATADGLRAGAGSLAEALFGVRTEPAAAPLAERPPGGGGTARGSVPGARPQASRPPPPSRPSRSNRLLTFLLAVGGLTGLAGLASWARRPGKCRSCGVRRVKLDEISEDAHLDPVERLEDEIGSVDHQVWVCPSCGDVMEVARNRWFSGYSTCSACGGRTWRTSEHVETYATTERTGLARIDGWCVSCDHRSSHTRVIPRKVDWDDDNSSGSSFFSSSGSGSSSRSSGRSSSGFGGGHSSGGGSSGRW